MVNWDAVDTVFLDVDGSLIDLHYEFVLWQELLPSRFAERLQVSIKAATDQLYGEHGEKLPQGLTLYSIPNWSQITGLNMVALHRELIHLLQFHPGVEEFLQTLKQRDTRVVIVTNAHSSSFNVKNEVLSLSERVDAWYSSEHIGLPKEDPDFWGKLATIEPFDPRRTLFIDDTPEVLDSARSAGIAYLLTTAQPDLSHPVRAELTYPSFHDYNELLSSV